MAVGRLPKIGPKPADEKFAIPTIKTMKLIKYLFAVAAITGALTLSAKADLQFLGAEAFTDGGNNSPAGKPDRIGKLC